MTLDICFCQTPDLSKFMSSVLLPSSVDRMWTYGISSPQDIHQVVIATITYHYPVAINLFSLVPEEKLKCPRTKIIQRILTFILFPGLHLGISAENECRQLHCTLRDLTTMERALGRLSEHFIGEVNFANRFSDGEAIVERLGQIALFGTQSQLFAVHAAVPSVLQPDLIEV